MDKHLILIGAQNQIESDLQAIDAIAAAYWIEQGYTVIADDLIGKNALTGEDMIDAQKTTTWDEIKEHDGQYWIWSLSNDDRFSEWKERLADVGYQLKSIEKEKDWDDE